MATFTPRAQADGVGAAANTVAALVARLRPAGTDLEAAVELTASGIRVRREWLTGVESLTASERRIAELASSGASNAETAQSLFVTVKTVLMHLTHTYRKLEVSGRRWLTLAVAIAARRHPDTT